MRTQNTVKNMMFSFVNIVLITLLNIAYRTVFIQELNLEYLGINAALTNILTLLSLAELGVAQAISFYLYKPLSHKDEGEVALWINLFKKIYMYVGLVILFVGFFLSFFIDKLIPVTLVSIGELRTLLILFLVSSSITYFLGYKRTLIIADQKNYEIVLPISISQFFEIVLKICILIYTKSMIATILVQIIIRLLENLYVNRYIEKKYKEVFSASQKPLSPEKLQSFKVKMKSLVFHKVGDVFVNGTDNIIISALVGVSILGIFSNYSMLIAMSTTIVLVIFNSITSSLGNLIAEKSEKSEGVFNSIQMISFWIFGLISFLFFFLVQDFIILWIGEAYLLDNTSVLLLAINFFLLGVRVPLNVVKTAAGLFEKDRYAPLCQGALNLMISIYLCNLFGVNGVLLGTLLSICLVPLWTQPYVVYKALFDTSLLSYFSRLTLFSLWLIGTSAFIYYFFFYTLDYFNINNLYGLFILKFIFVFIFFNSFMLTFYFRKKEFNFVRKKVYELSGKYNG